MKENEYMSSPRKDYSGKGRVLGHVFQVTIMLESWKSEKSAKDPQSKRPESPKCESKAQKPKQGSQ